MGCDLITPPGRRFLINRLLQMTGAGNESMLWAESWLREASDGKNLAEFNRWVDPDRFDYVVNLSMTIPATSNLWWILGTPLDQTIGGMAKSNVVARLADLLGRRAIAHLDRRVLGRFQSRTEYIVANSPYLRDLHRERGIPVSGVVYTLTDLSDFRPTREGPHAKYVLLYLGKETDPIDFDAIATAGVRLIAFGSKLPVGTRLSGMTRNIAFRGRVSRKELIGLYSNAWFTLFPFTDEPMGLVPIESMACGTPVLTYNRQGPASTVVDGETGWLVNSPGEMVAKAVELWHRDDLGISREACVRRAEEFTVQRSVQDLLWWIDASSSSIPWMRKPPAAYRIPSAPASAPR
jgi:glycosyltransferase involved in cell wall biosynthesis